MPDINEEFLKKFLTHDTKKLKEQMREIAELPMDTIVLLCMVYYTITMSVLGEDATKIIRDETIKKYKEVCLTGKEPLSNSIN
jgi:hypothetical protein